MSHPWTAEIVAYVSQAVRAMGDISDPKRALETMIEAALSICEGERGVLLCPGPAPGEADVRVERALTPSSPTVPPAFLEQVARTGRSHAPPGLDGIGEADEPSNGFGPVCGFPVPTKRGPGVFALRLNGHALDAARWSALNQVALCASFLISSAADAELAAKLRDAHQRAAEVADRARRRRKERLGDKVAEDAFSKLIGCSEPLLKMVSRIDTVGAGSLDVLIAGETGTGKELVAQAIHNSSRPGKPFVKRDAGRIRGELVQSELFGHEKGAFTGATEKFIGALLQANGGTFLLDEVQNLTAASQEALLRFLEDRIVRPVGGLKEIKVDVRFLCTTNQDLRKLVAEGKFREDLLYRLEQEVVQVPTLGERLEDISQLVHHWLSATGSPYRVHAEAMAMLIAAEWKGNIRQLKYVVMSAFNASQGEISPELIAASLKMRNEPSNSIPFQLASLLAEEARLRKVIIVVALELCEGDVEEAARLLGYSENGYRKHAKKECVNLVSRTKVRKKLPNSRGRYRS